MARRRRSMTTIPLVPVISNADMIAAFDRMTETETADTLAEIHQSYTNELEKVHA